MTLQRRDTLLRWTLGLLPFVILVAVYLWASHARLEGNPEDKLLPSPGRMWDAMWPIIFEPDPRTGRYQFFADTWASVRRLGIGACLAAIAGLFTGVNMGLSPRVKQTFGPFLTFVSLVPPLSILPILFIALGVEEVSKITLIFIGIYPLIARDILMATEQIPVENLVKALTLGATRTGVIYRVVMPQVLPTLIDTVRLTSGAAWLFLIAAEAIASTEGLGYRIFLVRRYLAMDIILPYVAWITFLGFATDWALRFVLRWRFRWYVMART